MFVLYVLSSILLRKSVSNFLFFFFLDYDIICGGDFLLSDKFSEWSNAVCNFFSKILVLINVV